MNNFFFQFHRYGYSLRESIQIHLSTFHSGQKVNLGFLFPKIKTIIKKIKKLFVFLYVPMFGNLKYTMPLLFEW